MGPRCTDEEHACGHAGRRKECTTSGPAFPRSMWACCREEEGMECGVPLKEPSFLMHACAGAALLRTEAAWRGH